VPGPTTHIIKEGDARDLSWVETESVHLVCTSPPYGSLKEYPDHPGQMGNIPVYEEFLDELDKVWREALRILVPGGRIACVVGDICISRKRGGRHHVLPLSADIQVRARKLGFDALTPIRWAKIANIKMEASRSSRFLGQPNQPNGIIKNDLEHILLFRKGGGYRSPSPEQKELSRLSTDEYSEYFSAIWADVPGQLRRDHPAPYPIGIPRRLIKMFSFVGDTVVDPFAGTGTTPLAAVELGRNSLSVEIDPSYVDLIQKRLGDSKVSAQVEVLRSSSGKITPQAKLASK
jgi:site-specific DNA-methyltransferase (adenine-specific)